MSPQMLPSKMQSREHPFNRSTRPLLERRANMAQPQVLSSKQINVKKANPTRGYNDFNLITQQYENINSNKGYPYGSPPSPTSTHLNNIDFQFSDVNGTHYRPPVAPAANFFNASTNRNNSDHEDDDDYDELVYRHNQLNVQGTANVARRRLIDVPTGARRSPPPPIPPQRIIPLETPPPPPRGDTPENEGPFVFGVHHPNTFTPAYDKAKDAVNSPNSSMQVSRFIIQ